MTSRPARLRPTLNVKLDMDGGAPEVKRRRLGNVSTLNGNGGTIGTTTRSGNTGPRTRGMMELNLNNGNDLDESRTPVEDETVAEVETERRETSSDSSSSESSDSSDSEESSDMDEDECDKKRTELQFSLSELDKQFVYLRELFYGERTTQVEQKFELVKAGTAIEFINQLQQLQENMKVRVVVASGKRDIRINVLETLAQAEHLSAKQTLDADKAMLSDSIKQSLEEKIHRLEQDRNNDFSSELWIGTLKRKISTSSKDLFGERKKKATIVSGPFIVYMLHDVDIMEDMTAIKKAAIVPRRKPFVGEAILAY